MNPHGRCAEAADGQGPGDETSSSAISYRKLRLLGGERQIGAKIHRQSS
jgi:hypothetical protein